LGCGRKAFAFDATERIEPEMLKPSDYRPGEVFDAGNMLLKTEAYPGNEEGCALRPVLEKPKNEPAAIQSRRFWEKVRSLTVVDFMRELIRVGKVAAKLLLYMGKIACFVNVKIVKAPAIGGEPSRYNFLFPDFTLPLSDPARSEE
jgi:hypothetical protein